MSLRADLKISLRRNVRLANYTTMQVGGPAAYFADPSTEEELIEAIEFARHENLPWIILGKGSNIIFPDEGYPGLVICLIHYEQDKIEFDSEQPIVHASSGIYLYRLVLAARDHHLSGMEFLCNVPGTVGGAVVMNAGFSRFPGQRSAIGDLIEEVTVLNAEGKKEVLLKSELSFSYRRSNLAGRVVLSAKLRLWRRRPEEIQEEIRANFKYRSDIQDLKFPSSGSIFKNPGAPHPTAGQLIDQLKLKGTRIGGAMVSEKHGNYFINTGSARSEDLVALIKKIQKAVLDATQILLEPEVRIIEKS